MPMTQEERREYLRDWNKQNADKRHASYLKWAYGITQEEYDRLLKEQDGRCAICRADNSGREGSPHLFVDHDHRTNIVRGLLCHSCNMAIGYLKDNPITAYDMACYIAKHNVRGLN